MNGDARFDALFNQIPSLALTINREGAIVAVNGRVTSALGYDPPELIGRSACDLVDEKHREEFAARIEHAVKELDGAAQLEVLYRCKDGSPIWTRGSLRAMPGGEGQIELLLVCLDITASRTSESTIRAQQSQVWTLQSKLVLAEERERRRLAAGLHDEIGHSLALAQLRLAETQRNATADLRAELDAVRELLAGAIAATRSLTFELSSPVLYELGLEAALASVSERISAHAGIPIAFQGDGQPKPLSEDAGVLLFRASRELLLNLAKHARATGASVSIERAGRQVRICVTDDGAGFDFDAVRSATAPGHGLLNTMESIRSIGGSLQVDTAPGRGTCCTLLAPLDEVAG